MHTWAFLFIIRIFVVKKTHLKSLHVFFCQKKLFYLGQNSGQITSNLYTVSIILKFLE